MAQVINCFEFLKRPLNKLKYFVPIGHSSQTALQTGQNSYSNGQLGGGFNFSAVGPGNGSSISLNSGGQASFSNGNSSFTNFLKNTAGNIWGQGK